MIRNLVLMILLPLTGFAQTATTAGASKDPLPLNPLIAKGKIKGSIYDAKRVVLWLTDEDSTQEYLIDSITHFRQLHPNKISFLAYFNDVASHIKIGYVEICSAPGKSKVLFLNDRLVSLRSTSRHSAIKTSICTKSYARFNSITVIWHTIHSSTNPAALFTYSTKSKLIHSTSND